MINVDIRKGKIQLKETGNNSLKKEIFALLNVVYSQKIIDRETFLEITNEVLSEKSCKVKEMTAKQENAIKNFLKKEKNISIHEIHLDNLDKETHDLIKNLIDKLKGD